MGLWNSLRGTTSNIFGIGDGVDSDKKIEANIPGTDKPALRFNHISDKWEYSHNGIVFFEFSSLSLSRVEQDYEGNLMPADGFTATHLGGLLDADSEGNLIPSEGTDLDTFLELDASDNIQPNA